MNGSLLPFGWAKFLRATFSPMGVNTPAAGIDRVRVFALGVKPEYQHLGIAAAFYDRCLKVGKELNQPRGETGWILEVNKPMNRAMEGMGGKVVKSTGSTSRRSEARVSNPFKTGRSCARVLSPARGAAGADGVRTGRQARCARAKLRQNRALHPQCRFLT